MGKAVDIVFEQRKEMVEKALEDLKTGEKPFWQKGWNSSRAVNPTTGNKYQGVNSAILLIRSEDKNYLDNRWVTFKQAETKGWKVKKGEKAVRLEYWKWEKAVKTKDEKGEEIEKTVKMDNPMVSYFTVFNAEQLENIPSNENIKKDFRNNELIENILKNSEAPIIYGKSDEAFYSPEKDKIYLPKREFFENEERFYAVALHEIAHSTGHESRLGRISSEEKPLVEKYAREELVAELTSMFLQQELGIKVSENEKDFNNHKAYLQHYINILEKDPNELFRALKRADQAAEKVLDMGKIREIYVNKAEEKKIEIEKNNIWAKRIEKIKKERINER